MGSFGIRCRTVRGIRSKRKVGRQKSTEISTMILVKVDALHGPTPTDTVNRCGILAGRRAKNEGKGFLPSGFWESHLGCHANDFGMTEMTGWAWPNRLVL